MIAISAWQAHTRRITELFTDANPDDEVWTGADGSIIIDGDGEMYVQDEHAFTTEYTLAGTVAAWLGDADA